MERPTNLPAAWRELPDGVEIINPDGTTTFAGTGQCSGQMTTPGWLSTAAVKHKVGKPTREKIRRPRTRKRSLKAKFTPAMARDCADFVDFTRRCHAVYGRTDNNPLFGNKDDSNQPPIHCSQLLTYLKSLSRGELSSLISQFVEEWTVCTKKYEGHSVGNQLSREQPFTRAAMYQIALGNQNVCTYALRFGDQFLAGMAQRSSQSLTEIINKTVRTSLETTWAEQNLTGLLPLPTYWHVLDYVDEDPAERGPGGFHIHGEIVASNGMLRLVREAFELASNGYESQKRFNNKIVHFGEPTDDYSNRGGNGKNCLSDYPEAVRAQGSDYHFKQPGYVRWKEKRVRDAEKALKINAGKMWGRSDGLTAEAQAALGIFKLLLDNLPGEHP